MQEEKAIAILLANLKGSKKKPSKISDFALACRTLKNNKEWGLTKMSKFFRVSKTQLREIDMINELEPKYKKLANEGKIGMTVAYQISRIDEKRRSEAFMFIQKMNRDEIRDFVYFLVKNPAFSVLECKKLFEKSQLKKVTILALPITDEMHKNLRLLATKRKQSVHDYALKILEKSLKD